MYHVQESYLIPQAWESLQGPMAGSFLQLGYTELTLCPGQPLSRFPVSVVRLQGPQNHLGSLLQVKRSGAHHHGSASVPKDLHFKMHLSPRNPSTGGPGSTLWELLVLAKRSLDSPSPARNNYLPVTVFLSSPS